MAYGDVNWDAQFEDGKPRAYTTIQDVVEHEVRPALGEFEDDYDAYGIARECWDYVPEYRGYVQVVDEDEFWDSAIRNMKR